MIKRFVPALALAAALTLGGCATRATGASDASVSQTTGGAARFSVYDAATGDEYTGTGKVECWIVQDNQTGVRYLMFSGWNYGTGITPLLRADGTPDTDPEAGL